MVQLWYTGAQQAVPSNCGASSGTHGSYQVLEMQIVLYSAKTKAQESFTFEHK